MPKLKSAKVEKLIYLSIAVSPGGFKIFILAAVGMLSSSKMQGEVANDLAIIAFLSMLTAIGAGTQILHIIPKEHDKLEEANQIFKGLLTKLIPYVLLICGALHAANLLAVSFLAESLEASTLLFAISIYWLFRHYLLARSKLIDLLVMEGINWLISIVGLFSLNFAGKLTSSSALLVIAVAYLASFASPLFLLVKIRANYKTKIINDSISIGLSNFVSGGIVNLAPSICFHVGPPLLAGAVGLMTNISSIALVIIRAYLLKKIPEISNSISHPEQKDFKCLYNRTKKRINSITIKCFFAIQPISVFAVCQYQKELEIHTVAIYSFLIAAFVCAPQFSAVESVIINFFGRSKSMLVINSLHALTTLAATGIAFLVLEKPQGAFAAFLAASVILYAIRNIAATKITHNEAASRKLN